MVVTEAYNFYVSLELSHLIGGCPINWLRQDTDGKDWSGSKNSIFIDTLLSFCIFFHTGLQIIATEFST